MLNLPTEMTERLAELAPTAFYGLMVIALFTALLGALGAAMVFLVLGSVVHVARVGLEAL
jgi:hypothetical protein